MKIGDYELLGSNGCSLLDELSECVREVCYPGVRNTMGVAIYDALIDKTCGAVTARLEHYLLRRP